ncbi:GTP cyclohydrolase FolE2 [Candidatus Nitrosacidococcus tergens]|uniref:GTP cyclohydrolase FolE2 n=1 Tax=Candidatus Nitrosacidococcus tergens TaxID=553981 RepID=A0A7G1Q8D7_9GAMM|nr:GTP cyclohydrolase FolE2 [Candidatus Nitrosacidococcus tergens]CAB1274930.1 GTP cyclohydrolase FolE2 [Candidatus Nitrosacidococcus tergens]
MNKNQSIVKDIHSELDKRNITIHQVGIKDIRYPLQVKNRSGEIQHTVAQVNMYVGLAQHLKGAHMSRFVTVLNQYQDPITLNSFQNMPQEMKKHLQADSGYIEMEFPYFINKQSPISTQQSLLDYQVSLIGESYPDQERTIVKVVIPITSLCPCSKEISDYGAHNQRSYVTVQVQIKEPFWIEDIVEIVEQEASCEIYSLLKRSDEKYITERAYNNPKFVEDIVRDIAAQFNLHEKISAYTVEVENIESIHNHSAYAKIDRLSPI